MRHRRSNEAREDAAGEAFWRFSLAFYGQPGVADALIAIQDRAGRDVTLMLYALWLGVGGHRLAAAELTSAEAAIAPINAMAVGPLRRLRRQLKGAADPDLVALGRRVGVLELAAERRAHYRLAAGLRGGAGIAVEEGRLAAAEANLALYLDGDAGSAEARMLCRALAALTRAAEC